MSSELELSGPSKAPPAFPCYAQDFLVSVAARPPEFVGGYFRLLCYQWTNGGLPKDRPVLRALSGCGGRVLSEILSKFDQNPDGFLRNNRLEKIRAENMAFRKRQSDNAKARWDEGGRAKKPMPRHMPVDMPSSSVFIDNTLSAPTGTDSRAPRKPRERNELLDALASCNGSDPQQVTGSAWGGIAKALAEIKAVSPDVTADEIRNRSTRYRQLHRDWTLTANALAKHWGKLAGHWTQAVVPADEPHDWLELIRESHPHLIESLNLEHRTWNNMPRHVQDSVKSAIGYAA